MIRPLVEAHRIACLESPGSAVPFAFGIAAEVGRIIVLGDLQLNVEIPLQILLHQLDLRSHLGEVFIVEEGCFKTLGIARLRQELLRFFWAVLPIGAKVGG